MPLRPSGRPQPGEYAEYMTGPIAALPGEDIVAILEAQVAATEAGFRAFADRLGHAYAPGKWTVGQVLGHLIDDERIFGYRMLCVARKEPLALPGFDENLYVATAGFEGRGLEDLLAEYRVVRASTLAFLRGMPVEAWDHRGTTNGYSATVRGLAFQIVGHERHHLGFLEQHYRG
ncbi:MAG TPA: DinB family protein [Holophagaceae bacterium]|nr:DinB family protein [Holophagaceae bacterium]